MNELEKYILAEWKDSIHQVINGNDPIYEVGYYQFYVQHCGRIKDRNRSLS